MPRKKKVKSPAAAKLGAAIREARDRLTYSQQHVAAQFGLTRQAVGAWESGDSMPDGMQLRQLAVLLKDASLLGIGEEYGVYLVGSSHELQGVHSVPLKGVISPINGGFWMDNEIDGATVRGRVRFHFASPEMYAYQVLGDELFPRVRNGEFLVVDPAHAVEPGDEVVVALEDGRTAVLQLISKRLGMLSFQRISVDGKPFSIAENLVRSMHYVRSISKLDDFLPDG